MSMKMKKEISQVWGMMAVGSPILEHKDDSLEGVKVCECFIVELCKPHVLVVSQTDEDKLMKAAKTWYGNTPIEDIHQVT